ncbi:MAG: aminotransferase class I/II-fold pyridoxal phosphate-dependent enzyme [Oscillospiraceae bacterium]|nr:aminotransferase class I/II-fold pyridoxal phosphate-dependent enzyme [Oscillospiraceae bacterium]
MVLNDAYGHGGDIYHNDVELDFSANVNPLGTPAEIVRAVAEAAGSLSAYPDPYCGKLRKKLSNIQGVDMDDIVCGNGAADLIFQFATALRPKKTLLPVPSFSEYEAALDAAGCKAEYYYLSRENGFAVTEDILERITPETELLMLCSPNNPTGISVDAGLLEEILAACRKTGTWLFLDECFLELTDNPAVKSLIPELVINDRVFILRAFTKLYGMAGARLGYAICKNRDFLLKMCASVQPWNVSSLAQAAGKAALDCGEFAAKSLRLISEEKKYLLRELKRLGIAVLPGEANFLMLQGVPGLYSRLLEKKILIRSCANYRGLDEGDCRIAVKTHGENERLIAALEEIIHA